MSETVNLSESTLATFLRWGIWIGLGAIVVVSPLLVDSSYFFPYITSKVLVFLGATQIITIMYLALALINTEYKIKLNLATVLFGIYLLTVALSSWLGLDWYRSFWGNVERGEGIFMLIHLWLLLFVLGGFVRTMKEWLVVFDGAFIGSVLVSLYGLAQYLQIHYPGTFAFGLLNSTGNRIDATIGNPGYVAGYLVFGIFFGLILLFKRENYWLRWAYVAGIVLEIFVTFNTGTRGGMLALLAGVAALVGYFTFYYKKEDRRVVSAGLVALVVGLILVASLFSFKDSPLVRGNYVLSRIASISLTEGTAQNRIMVWKTAIAGFRERPVLGWGYENFYIPFNKYFSAELHEPWFDRSHNMIFDRLLTGGIVGLIAYLAFLLVPYYFLWRKYWTSRVELKDAKLVLPVILTVMLGAYVIQNMFIFEALVTYVPLLIMLSFVSVFGPRVSTPLMQERTIKMILLIGGVVILVPCFYLGVVKNAQANSDLITILSTPSASVATKAESFRQLLAEPMPGTAEYRQQLYFFFRSLVGQGYNDPTVMGPFLAFIGNQLEANETENPYQIPHKLSLIDFYNLTGTNDVERLGKSLAVAQEVVALSPGRPLGYSQVGTTYFYLAMAEQTAGNKDKALEYKLMSDQNMIKAISLNPELPEAYRSFLVLLAYQGDNQQLVKVLGDYQANAKEVPVEEIIAALLPIAQGVGNAELVKVLTEYK